MDEDKYLALFEDDSLENFFKKRTLRKRRADPTWNSSAGSDGTSDDSELLLTGKYFSIHNKINHDLG